MDVALQSKHRHKAITLLHYLTQSKSLLMIYLTKIKPKQDQSCILTRVQHNIKNIQLRIKPSSIEEIFKFIMKNFELLHKCFTIFSRVFGNSGKHGFCGN